MTQSINGPMTDDAEARRVARQLTLRECMILPNGFLHPPALGRMLVEPGVMRSRVAPRAVARLTKERLDKWQHAVAVGLLLVFLPPAGALVLWSSARYTREARVAASASVAFMLVVVALLAAHVLR